MLRLRLIKKTTTRCGYLINILYITACVQNKAQLYASSACISGYVLSDKEQNENINKQLCWINLATVVAGLMKSKLTESQHIDICRPINLLNKKWGDKNPPQATKLWLKPHKKKQSSRESWKAKKLLDTCKTMEKKLSILNVTPTKRQHLSEP